MFVRIVTLSGPETEHQQPHFRENRRKRADSVRIKDEARGGIKSVFGASDKPNSGRFPLSPSLPRQPIPNPDVGPPSETLERAMMRATFFSIGLFITLWGVSLLFVDKIVLSSREEAMRSQGFRGMFTQMATPRQKVYDPPDWAAFSMLSIGAVTMLYSVALPKKKGGE
jgi:hypothetical protein